MAKIKIKIENVVASRRGNLEALYSSVARQWAIISPIQDFSDPNRTQGAKEDLTFLASGKRGNPDIGQIGPDLLAVVYLRLFHSLPES